MIQKKDNRDFVMEAGLSLMEVYFREKVFFELAMDEALIPKATDNFSRMTNVRVRKLIHELEALIQQYKQEPPTQTGGR